ncbi:MAG: hypothetical protein U5R14_01320 [Gemmatimonadota bacterium]|nr:hypothetical protein [Gemmatimonadota bacterium]
MLVLLADLLGHLGRDPVVSDEVLEAHQIHSLTVERPLDAAWRDDEHRAVGLLDPHGRAGARQHVLFTQGAPRDQRRIEPRARLHRFLKDLRQLLREEPVHHRHASWAPAFSASHSQGVVRPL